MQQTEAYYLSKIKEDLSLKQRQNKSYSLRAYARDLGFDPSSLSQIMKGKRPIPVKQAPKVADKLKLGPKERTLFMESLLRSRTSIDSIKIDPLDERFMLDESYYKIIAEWEHYVLLELFNVEGFCPSVPEIAARLGVTQTRAEVVINNMLTYGLLARSEQGELTPSHPQVRTTEDVASMALKESHRETLRMGLEKLEDIDMELRDFSSSTIPIDMEKLPEAKTIIREFRQKMAALMRDANRTEVYQLAIQFYPLTDVKKN